MSKSVNVINPGKLLTPEEALHLDAVLFHVMTKLVGQKEAAREYLRTNLKNLASDESIEEFILRLGLN